MSWWRIELERGRRTVARMRADVSAGAALAIARVVASHFRARVILERAGAPSRQVDYPATRRNPTLVHHGLASSARFHLIGKGREPLADLYVLDGVLADRIAHVIANRTRSRVVVLRNVVDAKGGSFHTRMATARPAPIRPLVNGNPPPGWAALKGRRPTTMREAVAQLLEAARFAGVAKEVRSGKQDLLKSLEFARGFMRSERERAILDRAIRLVRRFQKNPTRGRARSRGKFQHTRLSSARGIARKSIRTAKSGKARIIVGCPKGKFRRGRCTTSTRALAKLTPKAKRNPADLAALEREHPREAAAARRTFKRWHGFEARRVLTANVAPRIPRVLIALGELHTVVYESDKWTSRRELYRHQTKKPRPLLCTGPDGRGLFLIGGRTRVTALGLVN